MRRPLVITLSVLAALAAAMVAWAYWTSPGAGTAQAASGSLAEATISVSAAPFNSITVDWDEQASLVPASPDDSDITYSIERRLDGGTWALAGGGCSGANPHGTTSCVDQPPASGSYSYRAVASFHGWTAMSGEAGPVAVTVDAAAPANAITLSGITGGAFKDASTVYYRGTGTGSFTLTNAVSDSGPSGPASSRTAALAGTSTGWSHSPSTVSSPVGGPYVSNAFAWSASTTSSPSETVTGSDVAGNTTATALTFTADDVAPFGGMVDATGLGGTGGRYSTSTALSIEFGAGIDAGSGMATGGRQLLRSTATLTSSGDADGSCGSYGAPVQVGADDPVSPVADAVTGQACHRYEYVVADRVGNSRTYTSPDIKVDTTAPAAPTLAFSAMTNTSATGSTLYFRPDASSGAFTVTAAATDANSGIDAYTFPTLPPEWTRTAGGVGVSTYSWSAPGAAKPSGAQDVTAINHAALASPATGFTLDSDSSAPATGNVSYTDGYYGSLSVGITFAAGTDTGGSGVDAASGQLQRSEATLQAGGTCGGYDTPTTVGGAGPASPFTDSSVVSGTCYQYRYVVSDNVGNQVTYTSTNVAKVDTAAPTISRAVVARADGSSPGTIRQGGSYYIYAQVSDNVSVSSVTADASAFDTEAAAAGQTAGSWTIGGLGYNRQSALLTANTPLTTGTGYGYTITAQDAAGNTAAPVPYTATIETYASVVNATSGLVSFWRFNDGDGTISDDTFTDTAGTTLSAHTGAVGASWTALASQTSSAVITPAGRLRKGNAAGFSQYYTSGVPPNANYLIEADVHVASVVADDAIGLVGRLDVGTGTDYYLARYIVQSTAWQILRVSGGVGTQVGSAYAQALTVGATYRLGLQMSGSTISLTVNGVARATGVDATITAAGRPGARLGLVGGTGLTDTTGLHLDNYNVTSLTAPPAADSKGTNNGTYTNGALVNQPGALVGDSDRAARLDGTNDYVTVPDAASLDLGDGAVTLEAWVKRNNTGAISAMVFFDRGTNAIEFAWEGTETVLVKSGVAYLGRWASVPSDTNWHHVVATRTSTSAKLYVDGTIVSGTNTPATLLNTSTPLIFGAQGGSSAFLAATIDEFAYYNVELSAATIQDHYRAGRGTG